ncbi:hypothetical protein BGZ72_005822 [Mortierella alpina]|nr:hypothetical protein BGZ72_005822 [Mortierella alpina]
MATSGSSFTSSLDDAAQESSTTDPTGMLPVEGTMLDAEQPGAHCTPSLTLPTHSTDTRAEAPASTAATSVQPSTLPETHRPLSPTPAPSPLSLSLGSTSLFTPLPTAADHPPPYSPTHTILPHYFSLEPIPLRSYLIKDSASMPFLYDFYLCATTSTSASPTLQLQERGLAPQLHQSELKYCIIRPQRTDRTAIPITNTLGPNTDLDFIPALALVAANYPARWIWWGTEALQMVVFGRQLKNVIMEWKWKHGETEGSMPQEPEISTHVDGIPLSMQEATADGSDEDDEELGCYHCREESPSGAIGRIVAVYKPGRPADRARDRPATYRRLEIYTEVGDRCETAMMLMCTRLDDLFMSIPEEKKTGVFVSNHRSSEGVIANSTAIGGPDSADGAAEGNNFGPENGEDAGRAARVEGRVVASDQRSEISVLKRLFAGQYTWRSWLKWTVAAILIAVVVVLLKTKMSG